MTIINLVVQNLAKNNHFQTIWTHAAERSQFFITFQKYLVIVCAWCGNVMENGHIFLCKFAASLNAFSDDLPYHSSKQCSLPTIFHFRLEFSSVSFVGFNFLDNSILDCTTGVSTFRLSACIASQNTRDLIHVIETSKLIPFWRIVHSFKQFQKHST